MKTIYITDLDGTLLLPDATLSAFSREALSRLYGAGILIALSTARTAATVSKMFDGVPLAAPAALMNGACVYDLSARRYLFAEVIPDDAQAALFRAVKGMCAFAYTVENGALATFYETDGEPHARKFRVEREVKYGKVFTKMSSLDELVGRGVVYLSLAGREETVPPVRDALTAVDGLNVHFYRDIYERDFFYLEACATGASKSAAARRIRELTGADRLVCFGDNLNDLPLFEACDEKIAVANAADEVKRAADLVIGANTEDSVARYILGREGLE